MGHLVHLTHRLAHLLDTVTLLLGGGRDLIHDVGDPTHGLDHLIHGFTGLLGQQRPLLDLSHRTIDELLDLLGRRGAAAGQITHLTGHHGKTATLLTGTRRLHRGVQRQNVGLKGDGVDDTGDIADLLRAGRDAAHGLDHAIHHFAAPLCRGRGIQCQAAGLTRVVGILAHRGGDLFHAGSRLLEGSRLLLGARREVGIAIGNLARADMNRAAAVSNLGDDTRQALLHVAHGIEELADLIAAALGYSGRQIGLGDGLQVLDRRIERPDHRTAKPHIDQHEYHQRQQQRAQGN